MKMRTKNFANTQYKSLISFKKYNIIFDNSFNFKGTSKNYVKNDKSKQQSKEHARWSEVT